MTVKAREWQRVSQPEPVKHRGVRIAARIVDLVREHDHGALGRAQDRRELLVSRGDAGARVDDEEDEFGLIDRGLRLLCDLRPERPAFDLVHAARVDEPEPGARPLAEELLAVARDAGRLVHDRRAALREPVDQCRLADVREADDRDGAGDLARRLELVKALVRAHRGGTASGRPSACISTRKSKSPRIRACRTVEASL